MNDHKAEMHIRSLNAGDLEQFNGLLRYAFQVTDEELYKIGWKEDEIKQSKFPVLESADVLGWFEGDRLASQIAVYPMQINIHGRIRNMGFVTGVATYPEYAGLGLMSELMKRSLCAMRERGQSISFLYPYSIPFYRRKGWEIVSDKMTFHIKDTQLPTKADVPGWVRRVDTDSPDLLSLHDRFARRTHGCLIRNDLAWDEYWRWDVDDEQVAVYYGENGEPLGYLVYLLENDVFRIKEMVYLNQEAHKGLWNYVSAHESMVDEVYGCNYYNHAIAFMLEDSETKETIRPYIMARIVDFEQFIGKYNFSDCDRTDALTFQITDSLLEWNNGPFTVEFQKEGAPRVSRGAFGKTVKLSIGTLTAMLMGYKRPAYLRRIERLEAGDAAVSLLESVIPKEKAYFSDYI